MMKKALFFDLDGTLWDSLSTITESWNKAMVEANKPYRFDDPKTQTFMGLTPEETAPLAFPDDSFEEGMKLFYLCLKEELYQLSIKPGKLYKNEEKVLQNLAKKYDLYILSNAAKGYIENYLNGYNFHKYFKGYLCAGDTGLDKHENILYLMKKEGLEDVTYIGDTFKDYNEARKAGVKFIHAAYGFGKIKKRVTAIASLDELEEALNKQSLKKLHPYLK